MLGLGHLGCRDPVIYWLISVLVPIGRVSVRLSQEAVGNELKPMAFRLSADSVFADTQSWWGQAASLDGCN